MSQNIKYKFTPVKELRANAKERLLGNMGTCALVTFLFAVVRFTLTLCTTGTALTNGIIGIVINEVVNFLTSGFLGVLQVIICSFYLRLYSAKGFAGDAPEQIRMSAPDKIIVVTLIMSAIQLVISVPYLIYGYLLMDDNSPTSYAILFGLFFGGMLISYIALLPLSFVYYVMSDMPYLNVKQTLKMSAYLMKGTYLRYIGLELSFIPVKLLALLSLGIGYLWVTPYCNLSLVAFYNDVSKKKAGN